MIIEFDDRSYVELVKSPAPGKLMLTILAKDPLVPNKSVVNSVEITKEQFDKLAKSAE